MASPVSSRPASTKSFSRYESSHAHPRAITRSRASTLSGEILLPTHDGGDGQSEDPLSADKPDHFEKKLEEHNETQAGVSTVQSPDLGSLPEGFDELPIELISLADRFIASLTTAKIYPVPPSIEKLSELFQDFYAQADSHISTHIQILLSRQSRDASPAPSMSSRVSARLNSKASKDSLRRQDSMDTGSQMLTTDEISERRKARRLLEHKRVALEEAIERRVCEAIYGRLWRHKSTIDEVRDEKLRGKTEALGVVGIGLKDLGIELDTDETTAGDNTKEQVEDGISKARQGLIEMNQSHNPLGKLQGLATTHQSIVELLTNLHQSSSSADEILPTLIYTLIRSPAEEVNAISNLNFIERFRSSVKINGEAAYCLTNLEAAITFLETVDLATLRADEASNPPRSSDSSEPPTKSRNIQEPSSATTASPVTSAVTATMPHTLTARSPSTDLRDLKATPPASPTHQRRLSNMFQPPAVLGAAGDAVMSTADQGFRNISTTLDSSFKLLFGRLKEQGTSGVTVPKTLDEARRMVSPRAMAVDEDNISEASSVAELEEPKDDRLLGMIAGGRARDRSSDSTGSGSKRVLQVDKSPLAASPPVAAAAVESMRNLGNTLNPLNRLGSMNVMRFGRTNSSTPPISSPSVVLDNQVAKIGAPVQRFVEMADAKEMKVGEVDALLKDYQRLVQVLKVKGLL